MNRRHTLASVFALCLAGMVRSAGPGASLVPNSRTEEDTRNSSLRAFIFKDPNVPKG